ncbi:hypothetical protein [Orenia marismortui]|uniref:Uncharacterized protein n=1 Tax=Orenia marismortui TaxID=46469 RepID=A0A4R8GZJ9_9FIRM|nr:hypothetical protein [Orenia marismortui]TDX52176.1 hypothetical protein C7959_10898 [Orenia marismortui]
MNFNFDKIEENIRGTIKKSVSETVPDGVGHSNELNDLDHMQIIYSLEDAITASLKLYHEKLIKHLKNNYEKK